MSEPVTTVVPNDQATELERLRQANGELVARHARDKAQLTALQTEAATLQAKLTETSQSLYKATVGIPLRAMAEEMSTLPDLFLEQFAKHFTVVADDTGVLTIHTPDGKPALDKTEKAIPWNRDALTKVLTDESFAGSKVFKTITVVSRASGAGQSATQRTTVAPGPAKPKLGLGLGLR